MIVQGLENQKAATLQKPVNTFNTLPENNVSKANKVYTIAFTGKKRNPNQIALLTVESSPLARAGGMGDVNSELSVELIKKGKDVRVFLPFFNAKNGIPVNKEGKPVFRKHDGTEFLVKDTGISTEFKYGARKSTATLFKVIDPKVDYPVYVIYSPDTFSKDKKEYVEPYTQMFKHYAAYSSAAMAVLKKLENDKQENFKPKFVNTTDWHTAFTISKLQKEENNKEDKAVLIHTIHNIGNIYQGKMFPLVAAINDFNERDIAKLVNDSKIQDQLKKLSENLKPGDHKIISPLVKNGNYRDALILISDNYDRYEENPYVKAIDKQIISKFPNKPWVYDLYNPSKSAIEECDSYTTVSEGFLREMQSNNAFAPGLSEVLRANAYKSISIVNGSDSDSFDPAKQNKDSKRQIKQLYSVNADPEKGIVDFVEGKKINKLHLQELLGKKNQGKNPEIIGYLDKNSEAPLISFISRYDPGQKGVDIFINAADRLLRENKDAQILLGGPGYDPNLKNVDNFVQKIIKKYPGRAVLINGMLPMNQYLAGSDMITLPSRWEPCGLVQLQGMRMGAIPVVARTGGLDDTVSDPVFDKNRPATGFKTKTNFMEKSTIFAPEEQLLIALKRACKTYHDKSTWNNMVKNALEYDSGWDKSIKKYVEQVYIVPQKKEAPKISQFA